MIRFLVFSISAIWAAECLAATNIVPRVTIKALIGDYMAEATKPIGEQSSGARIRNEFANGYISGVADSMQGKAWCDTTRVKRDEIDSDIMSVLKKLPITEHNKPAGPVIVKILAEKFPCK